MCAEEAGGPRRHVAVDLGASGGRVAVGTILGERLDVELVHRFPNHAIPVRGDLYWDVLALWREILFGLKEASKRGAIQSVGVDSWAVDYALVHEDGHLLDAVRHYRSSRHAGVMDSLVTRVGAWTIYEKTGIQFLPFNTLYQLTSIRDRFNVDADDQVAALMVPDLFHYWLCGQRSWERTNASTTQLYDPKARDWSRELFETAGLPDLFGSIANPGTDLGYLDLDVSDQTGLHGTKVVLPATHDTASAVAAVPAEPGNDWAYVSSGTWSLVGIETQEPVITRAAMEANLTNEAGIEGTTRFLKNVMGLWILQECRRAWGDPAYTELYAAAEAAGPQPTFDCDRPEFLPPGTDMPERVRTATGLGDDRGAIVRAIFETLAAKTAEVIETLELIADRKIRTIHVVGGGSTIDLLNRLIAERAGRVVVAGPTDSTLVGNILVQAEACGSIPKGQVRRIVRESFELETYGP